MSAPSTDRRQSNRRGAVAPRPKLAPRFGPVSYFGPVCPFRRSWPPGPEVLRRGLRWALLLLSTLPAWAADPTPAQLQFFENKIRPIFANNCYKCHSRQAEKLKANLSLEFRDGLLKGGETGPAIVPGDPDHSLLIKAVRYTDPDLQMPPKNPLSGQQIADLEAWVKMGAPDPRVAGATLASADWGKNRREHWAFQPVKNVQTPAVAATAWVSTPVDAFILAKLEASHMQPAAPADKRALLRRATFDLTGLPPTPEEAQAFANDNSPDAFAKVVDRLLASPRYGERWGRFWLDTARYADTKGDIRLNQDVPQYPFAWTYRDYVVRSFNEDKPYNQFVREQIAGDQLPATEHHPELAALGFLTLGPRFNDNVNDIMNDRIDVVCKGLLGLTVTCARCHDHKFDPIPQKDYYSLKGIFDSSVEPPEEPASGSHANDPGLRQFRRQVERHQPNSRRRPAQTPQPAPRRRACGQRRHPPAAPATNQPGPPRRRLARSQRPRLLRPAPPFSATSSSPMILPSSSAARPATRATSCPAISSPSSPAPIPPSSAWAAAASNWPRPSSTPPTPSPPASSSTASGCIISARALSPPRTISATSPTRPATPNSSTTWRHASCRTVGPSKNSIASSCFPAFISKAAKTIPATPKWTRRTASCGAPISSAWNLRPCAIPFSPWAANWTPTLGGPPVQLQQGQGGYSHRRTLYGLVDRRNLPEIYSQFDFANPDITMGKRYLTTVPQQALFMMNSPLVVELARKLVNLPEFIALSGPDPRIRFLYERILQRLPTDLEIKLGEEFVDDSPPAELITEDARQRLRAERGAAGQRAGPRGGGRRMSLVSLGPNQLRAIGTWAKYAHALLQTNEVLFLD